MSRPHKNPSAAASVAEAPSGPYTSIRDVERRVIENAGTGEALVRLDRKITDGLNLVHERIRDLSKDIKDARSEHRADISELQTGMKADNDALRTELKGDIAELKDMIRAVDAKVEANRERDRSEHRADIAELRTEMKAGHAELKDMIRALAAEGAANREQDRSEHRADIAELRTELKAGHAELKDMIRALAAEGAANRELVGEVRAMRRLMWILAGIILGIGIAAVLTPAVNAAFTSIFGG